MRSELAAQPEASSGVQPTRLRWLGHATFLLTSPGGVQLLLDPFNAELGYPVPELPPIDLVGVSHEHADHNNVELAPGAPKVLRGISASGWHPGTVAFGDGDSHDESAALSTMKPAAQLRGRTAFMSVEIGQASYPASGGPGAPAGHKSAGPMPRTSGVAHPGRWLLHHRWRDRGRDDGRNPTGAHDSDALPDVAPTWTSDLAAGRDWIPGWP